MTKIFIMCVQEFYVEVVSALLQKNIDPVLIIANNQTAVQQKLRQIAPNSLVLGQFELTGAQCPSIPELVIQAPSAKDLQFMARWEGATLQMMDRRNYDRRSVQELRHKYIEYIMLWKALIQHFRPEAVVMHATPHQGHDHVLYRWCEYLKIPVCIIDRTHLNETLFIKKNIESFPEPTQQEIEQRQLKFAKYGGNIPTLGDHDLSSSHLGGLNQILNDIRKAERSLAYLTWAKILFHPKGLVWARKRITDSAHAIAQKRPSEFVYRWQEVIGRKRVRECFLFYQKRALTKVPSGPFVFFPLHFQPERTTVPDGGLFGDQLGVVRLLLDALPDSYRLLVREHPRQFNLASGIRGVTWAKGRSREFYEELVSDGRVDLASLSVPTPELIAASRAVVTVSGTSGWEAVTLGKPALVFGFPWYAGCPGVYRIEKAEDCRQILLDEQKIKVDVEMVRAYASVLKERYAFRGAFSDKLLASSGRSLQENAVAYTEAIIKELS